MIFSYTGWNFAPPAQSCHSHTQEVWEERFPVKAEARKILDSLSLHIVYCYQFPSLAYWGRNASFDLLVVADRPIVALLVIYTPGQVQLQLHLGLLDHLPGSVPRAPVFLQYIEGVFSSVAPALICVCRIG